MNENQPLPSATFTHIGVDVAKSKLDIHKGGRHSIVENNQKAVRKWCNRVAKYSKGGSCPPPLVVLEATGGYERLLMRELDRVGIPFRQCNPRQIREFARSTGQLAKNDRIDAAMLTDYAVATRLQPRPPEPGASAALRSLVDTRTALIEDRGRWNNRLKQDLGGGMRKEAELEVRHFDRRIARMDKLIAEQIESDELLRRRSQIMEEVCGIGRTAAAALQAYLPELGSLNVKSVANLAGLAPHVCDSGDMRGTRKCWGGRRAVRQALYMPVLTAIRYNPEIRKAYRALVGRGKPPKVALVAMMRKMLIHLNTRLKDAQHECYASGAR